MQAQVNADFRTLTPAEERIARLVSGGRTNREVAAIVRVSPKTVEVNLSRVYRKLGLRNRTELAGRFALSDVPMPDRALS